MIELKCPAPNKRVGCNRLDLCHWINKLGRARNDQARHLDPARLYRGLGLGAAIKQAALDQNQIYAFAHSNSLFQDLKAAPGPVTTDPLAAPSRALGKIVKMNALTRRSLLAVSAATAALAQAPLALAKTQTAPIAPDATALANMIRRKQISPLEAVTEAINRAEAAQPKLNFIVTSTFDQAIDQAKAMTKPKGPFAGVPFLIKDLNDFKGTPTRNGSRAFLNAPVATASEPLIEAYSGTGLVVIGKSATPEQGYLPTTEPLAFGPTRNPWNLDRSSGGSSGGAAVAVAAGIVPFAHASDGGGSIRIPSANCGLFGLKPSRGRMIGSQTQTHAYDIGVRHVLTRSVRDSAAMFAATEYRGPGAQYPAVGMVSGPSRKRLKIGVMSKTATGINPDPEVQAGLDATVALLQPLGHTVTETHWPVDGVQFSQDFLALWATDAAAQVQTVAKTYGAKAVPDLLEPFTIGMAQMVAALPKGAIEAAVGRLEASVIAYKAWFASQDLVLTPVLSKPAVPIGYVASTVAFDVLSKRLTEYVGYTPFMNVTGGAAMSVPLHWTADGIPVGMHFAGPAGSEKTLFQLAYELEAAKPWAGLKPPVWFGG